MNTVFEKIKARLEDKPILAGALIMFLKTLVIAAVAAVVLFLLLWGTGVYDKLETALDLKYNAPELLVPMWTLLALCVLCMVSGMLMYFHKYKRSVTKTAFYEAVAPALGLTTKKEH